MWQQVYDYLSKLPEKNSAIVSGELNDHFSMSSTL
jgi:hypothetical protein